MIIMAALVLIGVVCGRHVRAEERARRARIGSGGNGGNRA